MTMQPENPIEMESGFCGFAIADFSRNPQFFVVMRHEVVFGQLI